MGLLHTKRLEAARQIRARDPSIREEQYKQHTDSPIYPTLVAVDMHSPQTDRQTDHVRAQNIRRI